MKITIPRFPQDPVDGQIHKEYTYINGEWLKSYNKDQYELIRTATKQGMKDYEREKELLKKTATQALLEDNLIEKLEQHHKEHKDLVKAIEFVLDEKV